MRRRRSGRRRGAADRITLTTRAGAGLNAREQQILRVNEAIDALAKYDARMAQVVEMRYTCAPGMRPARSQCCARPSQKAFTIRSC